MIFYGDEMKKLRAINKLSDNQLTSKIEELPFS